MTIVQVSRITQRKGLAEDLPQPLASAELGWAVDQRRLFIGNGSLSEGAPVVGNTEILTEFSDLLAFTTAYTYQGTAAGYTVQTGPSTSFPVSQSLQQRLDSFAIVTEFGATGDGTTDDTEAINRALFQLYCRESNPQVRRGLFFPAGVYKISDTLLIPPYCRLYGEGANSSIISFQVETWSGGTAYQDGTLVRTGSDPTYTYYRALSDVPAQIGGSPVPLSNTTYWDSVSLPSYVVQTADSLQQSGTSLGLRGATLPRNVEVADLSLQTSVIQTSEVHNILLCDRLQQATFERVNFAGPLTNVDLTAAAEDLSAVRFSSVLAVPTSNITFDKCKFSGVNYAITTNLINPITMTSYNDYLYDTKNVIVANSWFDTLYQGVILEDSVNGGPRGFRITNNIFDNIYAQGVLFTGCQLNATAANTFYDVANSFGGTATHVIIDIDTANNVSISDMFERTAAQAATYPRIRIYDATSGLIPPSIGMTNAEESRLGSYSRLVGTEVEITDGATGTVFGPVDLSRDPYTSNGYAAFVMDYTIRRVNAGLDIVRTGSLTVVGLSGDDSSVDVSSWSDDFTETADTLVSLGVTESGNTVTVTYNAVSNGNDGSIAYSVRHLT